MVARGTDLIAIVDLADHPDAAPAASQAPPLLGIAVMLAQLGAHASKQLAELVAQLSLSAADAAVLRLIAYAPGLSQREVADRLRLQPSRLVALVDALEARGLVERTRSTTDRRYYELRLTSSGRACYESLTLVIESHERALTDGLARAEQELLAGLLARLATARDLPPAAAYHLP